MSFDDGLMVGLMLGGGSGGSGDTVPDPDPDWDYWRALPDPTSSQVIYVVDAKSTDTTKTQRDFIYFDMIGYDGDLKTPTWLIDWGDGTTTQVISESSAYHIYASLGRYVITCTALDKYKGTVYIGRYSPHNDVLMAKYGSDTDCYVGGNQTYWNTQSLKFFKHLGDAVFRYGYFDSCYRLKAVELANPLTGVPQSMFFKCYALKKIDLSKVAAVGQRAFEYSGLEKVDMPVCTDIGQEGFNSCLALKKISAPLCTAVGSAAFYTDYSLISAEFAESCTFGTNAFQNCFSLNPRPDGSTD